MMQENQVGITSFSTTEAEEKHIPCSIVVSPRKNFVSIRKYAAIISILLGVIAVSVCAYVIIKTVRDGSCQNPCVNACGNNTNCQLYHNTAVCTCKDKHFGNPLSGCEARTDGCYDNKDCLKGKVCIDGSCQNPCDNACGKNTNCQVSHNTAVCICKDKHFGNPLSGCETRENGCILNDDCTAGSVCVDGTCHNPCDNACGNNTKCQVSYNIAVCTCNEETFGNPYLGCKEKIGGCYDNDDCNEDSVCVDGGCQNPCDNICGNNTNCHVSHNTAVCTCEEEHFGNPYLGCKEKVNGCYDNEDCIADNVCVDGSCQNPCDNACGNNTNCQMSHNTAVCTCIEKHFGDPLISCDTRLNGCNVNNDCNKPQVCVDGSCQDPCVNACGKNTNCQMNHNTAVCTCKDKHFGNPVSGCKSRDSLAKKYTLYHNKVSWFKAVQNCVQEGKRLAIVRNPEEQAKLGEVIGDKKANNFWIGGSDLASEGNYYWIDDYKPMTWKNFRQGEPNNCCGGEHCVVISNQAWNDMKCEEEVEYICESYETD